MSARRRTDPITGRVALQNWLADPAGASVTDRATAVRFSLEELAAVAPGSAVEVRVPPDGAVQAVEGPTHSRGTPPNVVETDPVTWLELVTGHITWAEAIGAGRVRASGVRADLSAVLPIPDLVELSD